MNCPLQRSRSRWLLGILAGCGWSAALIRAPAVRGASWQEAGSEISFESQVAPLLQRHCLECHGPTRARGGLRLHHAEDLARGGDHGPVLVPGDARASRLFQLIAGLDEALRMPPQGAALEAEAVEVLRRWIDAGAPWTDGVTLSAPAVESAHWSFQPMANADPPAGSDPWCRSPLDAFVRAALFERGIEPAPRAEPATLLRRLYLDLTGLPPSPEEIDAWLADPSDAAYAAKVDELLASWQYAERWSSHWLDLARYADSDGYEKDNERPNAWRWRDWVIESFHRDQPYAEFLRDQIAGDLFENAPLSAKVATGLHRNTLTNREGGVDVEQFRVEQVVDRVNTLGAAVLGLTVGCARCHSHKYDPLTQREFYELYAFFDSADEQDLLAPTDQEIAEYQRAKELSDRCARDLEAARASREQELEPSEAFAAWVAAEDGSAVDWSVLSILDARSAGGAEFQRLEDDSLRFVGTNPEQDETSLSIEFSGGPITAFQLEALADETLPGPELEPARGPGRADNGNFVLSEFQVRLPGGEEAAFSAASADYSQARWDVHGAIDGDPKSGWAVMSSGGARPSTAIFVAAEPIAAPRFEIRLLQQYGRQHVLGRFRIRATTASSHRVLRSAEASLALRCPATERTEQDRIALVREFARQDATWSELDADLAERRRNAPNPPSTLAPVLAERGEPRTTHLLVRGDFLRPGEVVEADVPDFLGALPSGSRRLDRRDLVDWLVDLEHPLTWRVFANGVWQQLFGVGLVSTPDDFGTRGSPPSHPQLLDWLARESQRLGGSRKALIRSIVLSATYRQSSRVRPELWAADPQNRWLARQNRFRVEAETVRDLALAAAGSLCRTVGGPSVKPPIPAGVVDIGYDNSVRWEVSEGEDRYRRGLYVHRQRTVPYPMLVVFDAPDTLVSCVERNRSNTPLQALTLRNDPAFLECALHLASKVLEAADSDADRFEVLMRSALARPVAAGEAEVLAALLREARIEYGQDPQAAQRLIGADFAQEATELAAWTVLARTLFGLEEFVTRE